MEWLLVAAGVSLLLVVVFIKSRKRTSCYDVCPNSGACNTCNLYTTDITRE